MRRKAKKPAHQQQEITATFPAQAGETKTSILHACTLLTDSSKTHSRPGSFFLHQVTFLPPPLFFSYMFSGILPFRYSISEKKICWHFFRYFLLAHTLAKTSLLLLVLKPALFCSARKKNPQVSDILNRELSEIIGKESGETHSPSLL